MRAVVLGGGGFIGSNLVRRLITDGHDVTFVDWQPEQWRIDAQIEWANELGDDNTVGYDFDLRLPPWTGRSWQIIEEADWVFHLAADMGGVGYFHSDADWGAAVTNGLITNNVLRAVRPHQRVFYASSACCYPVELQQQAPAPQLDESLIGHGTPDALYGAEKLHGLRLCSKMPNARVGVLHTVFGPLQEHEGRRMKFPAAVATKALAARETGTLELWGDGMQLRSYLFVDDAVEKIMRIMSAPTYEGPVNIGAQGAVTCIDVARMCLEIAGVPDARITTNPAEPSGVIARDCDNSEFNRRYGAVPQTSLRDGFARFMEWIDGLD